MNFNKVQQHGDPQRLKLCILIKTGQNSKGMKNLTEKCKNVISESIEPPTNSQFLNSSEHVKWSLHNL
jgi:hypothetical protein